MASTRKPTALEAFLALESEKGRRSLSWFVRGAWSIVEKTPYSHNWHIDTIAAHLEAVTRGDLRKLINNVPPGSGKSLLVSVFWNAWTWIVDPTKAFLYTSFDAGLCLRDAEKVRSILNHKWFQDRWGASAPLDPAKHHKIRLDPNEPKGDFNVFHQLSDGSWEQSGGWRYSTSVNGKTTGRHPDIKVIDDPTKPKEATKENLAAAKIWWQGTMRSRGRDPATVATVLIMQRLDEDDLAGYFLSEAGGGWVHVRIPLEFEPGNAFQTPWGKDPRTEAGESFWPSRFTPEVIREIRADTPDVATWSSQWQQDPNPGSGIIFEAAYLEHEYDPWELPTEGLDVLSWDFTFTDAATSDWVVGQALRKVGPTIYVMDQVRDRKGFLDSLEMFKLFAAKWPTAQAKLIEHKANGVAIYNTVSQLYTGCIKVQPGKDSKATRARSQLPVWAAGNVKLPRAKHAPWVLDLKREHIKFPRGKNDDQVDTLTQALIWYSQEGGADYGSAMDNWKTMLGIR
jgi:predicted phage terminase large subunit-like protein